METPDGEAAGRCGECSGPAPTGPPCGQGPPRHACKPGPGPGAPGCHGGFNGRMPASLGHEHPLPLALPVRDAVEATVEADTPQFRTVPLRGLDHRHRMVHVRALPHRLVMQGEAMPVLRDARRNARPDRGSGPALCDPAGMGGRMSRSECQESTPSAGSVSGNAPDTPQPAPAGRMR